MSKIKPIQEQTILYSDNKHFDHVVVKTRLLKYANFGIISWFSLAKKIVYKTVLIIFKAKTI